MEIVDDDRDRCLLRQIAQQPGDTIEETSPRLGVARRVAQVRQKWRECGAMPKIDEPRQLRYAEHVDPDAVRAHGLGFEGASAEDQATALASARCDILE